MNEKRKPKHFVYTTPTLIEDLLIYSMHALILTFYLYFLKILLYKYAKNIISCSHGTIPGSHLGRPRLRPCQRHALWLQYANQVVLGVLEDHIRLEISALRLH